MNDPLRVIPGVGASIAGDLRGIGIHQVSDVCGGDPNALYDAIETRAGTHVDRCMLYVLRCAVYFASEPHPEPAKLLWWNWKDGAGPHVPPVTRSAKAIARR